MKAFDLKEFNKDGNKYTSIAITFNPEEGLKLTEREETVSVRPQVSPSAGCDFISYSGSTSSKYFFEISGVPTPNDLFFTTQSGYRIKEFMYVLNENKEDALKAAEEQITAWIKEQLEKHSEALSKAQSAILV